MPWCDQEDGVAVALKHNHTCLTASGVLGRPEAASHMLAQFEA